MARATDLEPANEEFAARLADLYRNSAHWDDLVTLFLRRADRLTDRARRVEVRRDAAKIYAAELANKEAARETWRAVLEDGEDTEALERLVDDAVEREDYAEATELLQRLEAVVTDPRDKARIALREAELVADGIGDVETAIGRYERVLAKLDPASRPALQAIADLQEARDQPAAAANALEREMKLVADPTERGPIAERLARLYEQLDQPRDAIRALDVVRIADPDNFDALSRLCDLCEKTEEWGKLAELLAQRIEVEADDEEVSALTKKLAHVLADELDRGDEALAVFEDLANRGDASIREAYVALGDRLGWRGVVAAKLVEWWFDAKASPERTANLRGAFERFAEVGRDDDAVRVACEIARGKGADVDLARHLERLAVKTSDLDALASAHDILSRDMAGIDRARELVRQAEVQLQAGATRPDSLRHGEEGLVSVPPDQAEPLLARLGAIAEDGGEVVGLYERQIGRCKSPADRMHALARAAQVAAEHEQVDRARGLFDLALSATPSDDAVGVLERAARESDRKNGSERLRRALCDALAQGGQGARDGGRTRGGLLRKAASIARTDLLDNEQAFAWLGDALVAHVEPASLDALEELAGEVGDLRRAEAVLTRALAEVFEGPLVRLLLGRRAKLRRDELDDSNGAAADLKKLYDLSPTDPAALEELSALLTHLGDHKAMVQLYEDQILRGKDINVRAELARRVARLWEGELADPREAADAWRRVLRMKQGDPEATSGLEHAKANMLRKPPQEAEDEADEPPPAIAARVPSPAASEPRALAGEPRPVASPPASGPLPPASEPRVPSAPRLVTAPVASPEREPAHEPAATPEVADDLTERSDPPSVPPPLLMESDEDEELAAASPAPKPVAPAKAEPHEAAEAVHAKESAPREPNDESGEIDIPVDDSAMGVEVLVADDLAEMLDAEESPRPRRPRSMRRPSRRPRSSGAFRRRSRGCSQPPRWTLSPTTCAATPKTKASLSAPCPNGAPARTGMPSARVRSSRTSSTVRPSFPGGQRSKLPKTTAAARARCPPRSSDVSMRSMRYGVSVTSSIATTAPSGIHKRPAAAIACKRARLPPTRTPRASPG